VHFPEDCAPKISQCLIWATLRDRIAARTIIFNKLPNVPIFEIADHKGVTDNFEIMLALTEAPEKSKSC
jgi:hypothetical protein